MKPQPESSTQEVLAGLVERVTFHNAENGFCVLRAKARGHRELVTVIGHAAIISAGEWITATGDWVNDRTHGQEFKARFLRTSTPTSADGIEKYLSSGMIRGVGPAYAKKLVRAFGEKVFDVIEVTPDRLREVDGIGPVRAASILAAWAEQKAVREIMVFLHSHGVGTARAVRIFKTYGADAIQVMTENPYRLARDIRGIGFKTADAIAMKLGIEKTAMVRVRAGISYALTEAMDEGHRGLPTEELIPLAETLLEVPPGLIRTALDLELQEGTVVADRVGETPCIFLAGLHRAERTIAERLTRQANGALPWPTIDPDKALPWVEGRIALALAESQVAAIRLALVSKVLVMTGGPGVGKTTIVKAILRILSAKGVKLLLCAPTGRAAKRMTEATGFEAKTIHRLLEVDPKSGAFKRNEDNPLDCNMLVVDETSMVDVMLMQALMRAVPDKAALLIVGDIDQLSSVGPGQVLADIISSDAVPVVRLTEVFRQAAQSRIITSAHRINQGSIEWPDYNSAAVLQFNKVINEPDFLPLHVVRTLAQAATMVCVQGGKLIVTPFGKSMSNDERQRSLLAILFHIMLWRMDLEYFGRGLLGPWPQADIGIVLWSLSVSADDWQTSDKLTRLCTIPEPATLTGAWDKSALAMEAKILRPLLWFGLLEYRSEKIPNTQFGTRDYYRKTALFERLLKFDVKMDFSEGPRH